MPELPEVETVINILKPLVINKEIKDIDIFFPRLIESDYNDFFNLKNKKILDITRYGKYIFFHFSEDLVLISHLRMEGKYRYLKEYKRIKATSLIFSFKDGTYLSYDDTRKFGVMYLSNEKEYKNVKMIKKLGVEANKVKDSEIPIISTKFKNNRCIKELLLDQSIMCGIGNIYADEILFASKINPLTKGKDLSEKEIITIIKNAKIILDKAILEGGSTIHSFHPSEGVDGKFQALLMCYGKENTPCINCSTPLHKIFIKGRGTTFCPNCQINKDYEKAIGITGPIGSGKSTLLKHFSDLGYLTLSCDAMVHELYKQYEHKTKISRILGINFNIDNLEIKQKAREMMINDKEKKKKVENYIYSVLEKELLKYIVNNDKIAIEVPLLFKAHYQYMFKKIFVIKVNKEKQISNLESRNEININNSLKLNNDYNYIKENKVIEIENNSDLPALFKKVDENLN